MYGVYLLCYQARKSLKNVDWDTFYATDEEDEIVPGLPNDEVKQLIEEMKQRADQQNEPEPDTE